jgi:hypothetical protein
MEHVAEAVAVAEASVQLSPPVATTVWTTEQASAGAENVPLKLLTSPGANVIGPKTWVFGVGWLFTTITLIRRTLPVLRTVPVSIVA